MLKLVELIRMSGIELGDYKIHCAIDNKRGEWRPLQQYFEGTFEKGQSEQSQKNFECDHVLSIINLSNSRRWLFVGIYRVEGVRDAKDWSGYIYKLTRVPGLGHLDGRAIIDFPKDFRQSYLVGPNHEDQLIVKSISEEPMSIVEFPGFDGIRLSFETLASIIRQDIPSWRAALSNIGGIYLIVDGTTGTQYVGSAYGGKGLWQRWAEYAKTGHGGTKELRELLRSNGIDYASKFQFSLLEDCNINANLEYVMERECHWKDVLMTREFGLNRN